MSNKSAPRQGRHRLGSPGLHPCAAMPVMAQRLADQTRTRHLSDRGSWRIRPALAVGAGTLVALVSGWLTAGEALASQLGGH